MAPPRRTSSNTSVYAVCAVLIVALVVLRPRPSAPASVAPDARAAERANALEARVLELGREIERARALSLIHI